MSWTRLDDTLHGHPKALAAGLEAMGLWVVGLSYCGQYLTNGHLTRPAASRLAGGRLDELSARLVASRLWDLDPSGDGWQIHDFLEFNPSRVEVLAQREGLSQKRADAGRKGAAARWQRDGKPVACHDGNQSGPESASEHSSHSSDGNLPSGLPSNVPSTPNGPVPIPSRPVPFPDQEEAFGLTPVAAPSKKVRKKKEPKHSPEEIEAAKAIFETFKATFKAKRGVEHGEIQDPDIVAGYKLAKAYGATEGPALVRRAFEDRFVRDDNPTLRFIASKPDTWRGTKSGAVPVQPGGGARFKPADLDGVGQ